MAERQLPKLNVAGSIPVSRSNNFEIKAKKRCRAECEKPERHLRIGRYLRLAACCVVFWRALSGLQGSVLRAGK